MALGFDCAGVDRDLAVALGDGLGSPLDGALALALTLGDRLDAAPLEVALAVARPVCLGVDVAVRVACDDG